VAAGTHAIRSLWRPRAHNRLDATPLPHPVAPSHS
jgi:hypothetical protein